ncbi:MAG: SMP-30/gluconolactonase/LRE family protein [Verrucomicrobia bacterium]|nr:SMP-30/gluconolactonase/LRE family protein [Verrucomicrobiota bacterium]
MMIAIQCIQVSVRALPEMSSGKSVSEMDIRVERLDTSVSHPLMSASTVMMELIAEGFIGIGGLKWDTDKQRLFASDTGAGHIFVLEQGNKLSPFITGPEPVADSTGKVMIRVMHPTGLELDSSGRLIVCDQGDVGIRRRESRYKWKNLAMEFDGQPLGGPMDILLDGNGVYYFTDGRSASESSGALPALYRRAKNGRISKIYDGLTAPAGLAMSEDSQSLFVTNSDPSNPGVYKFERDEKSGVGDPISWPAPQGIETIWSSAPTAISQVGERSLAVAHGQSISLITEDGLVMAHLHLSETIGSLEFVPESNSLFVGGKTSLWRLTPGASK